VDEDNPSVYEVNATLDTLKKKYVEQIKDIKKKLSEYKAGRREFTQYCHQLPNY
jgi:hypothetical protein